MRSHSREYGFEGIMNFRDLGGYKTRGGRVVAWRRLFRSGYLHHMTGNDLDKLNKDIKLASVIDLRNGRELTRSKERSLLKDTGIKYFNTPLLNDINRNREMELYQEFKDMSEVYLYCIEQKEYSKNIIEALEIIAVPENLPLVFHCGAGKDRSGILAVFVLGALDVLDDDIIKDYTLTASHMKKLINRLMSEPDTPEDIKNLPAYSWEAAPESMKMFLSRLKQEYGSARRYLEARGADKSLFERLEKALLV